MHRLLHGVVNRFSTACPQGCQPVVPVIAAPRGQLPCIADGDATVGDSDAIISHVIGKYSPTVDDGLAPAQRNSHLPPSGQANTGSLPDDVVLALEARALLAAVCL
jgi:hypothetical protein